MSKGKFDAKGAMGWVKSRWSLVAFLVVAVLLVPAMVYFAMGMIATKQADFQKQVNTDAGDFASTTMIYTVPALLPGERPIEWNYAPNEKVVERFKAALDRQQASAGGVVAEALKHNKGSRAPLMAGVFPQIPANDLATAKQFRRIYVSDAVKALLDTIRAKGPRPPQEVAQLLADHQANFLTSNLGTDAAGGGADKLPPEKREQLAQELVALRMKIYGEWGEKLSVYATPAIFSLPVVNEADTPTAAQLWDWQVQLWTLQDLMTAVADANASAKDLGVTKSVVKRIETVTVDSVIPAVVPTGVAGDPAAAAAAPGAVTAGDAPDYAKSITGRHTGSLFDVVNARVVCVVATKDLPQFFDAVSRANLMTVTKIKLSKVDQAAELKDGYFYGIDGVTRVDMNVEALWLREWTKELMPKEVKVALGLEAGDPAAAGAPAGGPAGSPVAAPPSPMAPAGPTPAGRRAGAAGG